MATVKVIPAYREQIDSLRVAAYCRVSSDSADQRHSYAAQVRSYTAMIQSRDGWELADIYADEGITGTSMEKRDDFNRMIEDCKRGRIDRILVKSVSRFARNTKECLAAVRLLRTYGVSVLFEENHIDTATLTSEMLVSVFGAVAQQESISISRRLRFSYRTRMERGEFITCCAPYGYELIERTKLKVKSNEATIVRSIYKTYMQGAGIETIARQLTLNRIPAPSGGAVWHQTVVSRILASEKYLGDCLCQKYYTDDVFPYHTHENHGQRPQYYVSGTHPAIIDERDYQLVQALRMKKTPKISEKKKYLLSEKIYCAVCGTMFRRRKISNGGIRWVCRKHDRSADNCPNGRVAEPVIYAAFVCLYNKLRQHKEEIVQPVLQQLKALQLNQRMRMPETAELNLKIADIMDEKHKVSKLRSVGLIDDAIHAERQSRLQTKLYALREERERLIHDAGLEQTIHSVEVLMETLQNGPEQLVEFDEALFSDMVDKIYVEGGATLLFELTAGLSFTEKVSEV